MNKVQQVLAKKNRHQIYTCYDQVYLLIYTNRNQIL